MPHHRIPRASIHEDLRSLYHDGEQVVHITTEGEYFEVETVYVGQPLETRLAGVTHQFRLGVTE